MSTTKLEERKRRKRRRRRVFKGATIILVLGLLLVATLWAIRFFGFFKRADIEVFGNDVLSRREVLELAYADFSRDAWRPFFGISNQLAWPKEVSSNSLALRPRVKSIVVEKDFKNRHIILHVKERTSVGIWCFYTADPVYCGWFDEGAVLFAPAFKAQGSLLTVVSDYSRPRAGLGSEVVESTQLDRILNINRELEFAGINVQEIRLEDIALQELVVRVFPPDDSNTVDGLDILFSLRFSPEGLGQAIARLRERENIFSLDYIDLRVEGRMYYQ